MILRRAFLVALIALVLSGQFAFADRVWTGCNDDKITQPHSADRLICSLLNRASNSADELYAIKLTFWEYPVSEEYALLSRLGDHWSLFAKAGNLDYTGYSGGDEFARLAINTRETHAENIPPHYGENFRAYLSDDKWTSILNQPTIIAHGKWTPIDTPETAPKRKKSCVDGSALTAYRFQNGLLQSLYLHSCDSPSGLNDLTQKLVDIVIEVDPTLAPYIEDLATVRAWPD